MHLPWTYTSAIPLRVLRNRFEKLRRIVGIITLFYSNSPKRKCDVWGSVFCHPCECVSMVDVLYNWNKERIVVRCNDDYVEKDKRLPMGQREKELSCEAIFMCQYLRRRRRIQCPVQNGPHGVSGTIYIHSRCVVFVFA